MRDMLLSVAYGGVTCGITCSHWEHRLCIQCEGIGLKGFYILSDVPNWISRLSCWESHTLSLNGITVKLNHHVRSSGVVSGRTRDCRAVLYTSGPRQLGYRVLLHIKRRSHDPRLLINLTQRVLPAKRHHVIGLNKLRPPLTWLKGDRMQSVKGVVGARGVIL